MSAQISETGNLLEVPVANLEPGMYVAALDRPWLETPFSVQGFFVNDRDDIDFVAKHASYVMVDPRRQQKAAFAKRQRTNKRTYKDQTSLKSEFRSAQVDLESASESMKKVFARLRAGGRLDVKAVEAAVNPLIDSVLRNQEAMAALMRMKRKGDYLFNHSLAVAVWAAVLGRHLGLIRTDLKNMVLGAALIDVGMASVPDEIVNSVNDLSPEQLADMRTHVGLGVDLLKQSGLHPDVLDMVATHHERFNGSGYPEGLKGTSIPLFGRAVGLIDTYDAMITDRPFARGRTSFEAMQEINDLKDELFQGELVEQFMQAVGLFPTGSIVELSSGEVGVVVAQNPSRRLRPKVIVILDETGNRYDKLVIVDLANYVAEDGSKSDLWITKDLEPGARGIKPDEFFL